MKRPKNYAKKLLSDKETPARCYYCKEPTLYALYDCKDLSEVWACPKCIKNIGKVKRFRPKIVNTTTFIKSVKKSQNLHIKKIEDASKDGLQGQPLIVERQLNLGEVAL